jgi:hypothetical protein
VTLNTNPAILASTLTDKSLTVLIGAPPYPYTIDRDHPRFDKVVAATQDPTVEVDELIDLFSPVRTYQRIAADASLITIFDGVLKFDGEVVHSHLATRLKDAYEAGFSTTSWEAFVRNAALNPLQHVIDQMCEWLEAGGMPLTTDGHMLGFKYVDEDYLSLHADVDGHRYDHTPGNVVTMDRDRCDTDRSRTCSTGLHFCSIGYLPQTPGSYKIILVKVNPADVTSFPTDCEIQKGRTCRYEVVADVTDQYQHLIFDPVVSDYDEDYEAAWEDLCDEGPWEDDCAPEDDDSDSALYEHSLDQATPVVDSPVVGTITPTDFTRLVEENGGTQSGVAKRFGVSSGTVAAWKRKLFGGTK